MRPSSSLHALFLTGSLLHAATAQSQGTLNVDVELNEPKGGVVRMALCPNEKAYDTEQGCLVRSVAADAPIVRCTYTSLAPGTYAIKVFHDMDGNGKLNTSWIGWPQEPYGFGNDAPVQMGPPAFKLAAISVGGGERTVLVKLR
jgi:uncharacterized protein (DUF2141 family)